MTRQISIDVPQGANGETLRAELRAVLGNVVAGVSRTPNGIMVIVEDDAPDDIATQFDAIIAAHDPSVLSASQQNEVDGLTTANDLRSLIVARIEWHEANPITADSTAADVRNVVARMQDEMTRLLKLVNHRLLT